MTLYHIAINDGLITFDAVQSPTNTAAEYMAQHGGRQHGATVAVKGWPFREMTLTLGTEENGRAVAFA